MKRKLFSKLVAILIVISMGLMNVMTVSADNKVNGFPLPTTKTYLVTVLAKYSGGGAHQSYLYSYGPLKGYSLGENIITADIAADGGTPIYAVADGKIYTNSYGSNGGNYLVIAHYDGTYSYYGHMKYRSGYGVGSSVRAGDIIGYVGMTGQATGYHLHFEWSWHDVFCEFSKAGYVAICPNSGASKYPHTHSGSSSGSYNSGSSSSKYTAYVKGTGSSLAINSSPSVGNQIGKIPEGAACTVDPSKTSGNWYWVTYNGVSGYSYKSYLTTSKPSSGSASSSSSASTSTSASTYTAYVTGTGSSLAINSKPKVGNQIGEIPEGAACTVNPNKTSGNWLWVTYNGISGYSYKSYLTTSKPSGGASSGSNSSSNTGSSSNTWTGVVYGTGSSLAINSAPKVGNQIGEMPDGATCTVYPDKTSGNWYWVSYNGISGYAYKSYIVLQ